MSGVILPLLRLYLPSFLTRYSLQLMVVGLPWLFQKRGLTIDAIAGNFFLFFSGSIVAALVAAAQISKLKIRSTLIQMLLLQAVLSAFCIWTTDMLVLGVIRFFQGFSLGMLRPANQIWVNEHKKELSRLVLTKRAAASQVFISMGILLGSIAGIFAQRSELSENEAVKYGILACLVPGFLVAWFLSRVPDEEESVSKDSLDRVWRPLWLWLRRHPIALSAIFFYLLSLVIFKLWIVAIPFYFRADATRLAGYGLKGFLALFFIVHAFVFMCAQYFMSRVTALFPVTAFTSCVWVGVLTFLQGVIILGGYFAGSAALCLAAVFFGGGILAAGIYPLTMNTVYLEMKTQQGPLMRGLLLVLSVTADLGQLIACGLMALV